MAVSVSFGGRRLEHVPPHLAYTHGEVFDVGSVKLKYQKQG